MKFRDRRFAGHIAQPDRTGVVIIDISLGFHYLVAQVFFRTNNGPEA